MKHIVITLLGLGLAVCASAANDDKIVNPDSTGFKFTDVKVIKRTPVKNQNKSGTCWCFSYTSFLEDEVAREKGEELDLSEMFTVRLCYSEKADRYVRLYGSCFLTPGGSLIDGFYILDKYGIVPEEVYSGLEYGEDKHIHSELQSVLDSYVKAIVKKPNKRLSTAWRDGYEGILDAYLGKLPETFTYNGKSYTPQSYAKSLGVDANNYVALTSFTHHPFYKPFGLEVSDNWLWGQFQNVPLDELKAIVDNAIDNGYTVLWAADISEKGWKWDKGYAVMPIEKKKEDLDAEELARWEKLSDEDREKEMYDLKGPVPEIEVTPQMRQEMFDRQETTDDHAMVIVGKAVDQEGNKYYKVKNSWDTNQLYNGYIYVSEPYFLAKTMSLLVNKNAIPSDIAKKISENTK